MVQQDADTLIETAIEQMLELASLLMDEQTPATQNIGQKTLGQPMSPHCVSGNRFPPVAPPCGDEDTCRVFSANEIS